MKITFDDKSYIELSKSSNNKYYLTTAAKNDKNQLVAHTVELTDEQFKQLKEFS